MFDERIAVEQLKSWSKKKKIKKFLTNVDEYDIKNSTKNKHKEKTDI